MKKMILFIILLGFTKAFCQNQNLEIISSTGDYYQGNTTSMSWTLGELAVETFSKSDLILTQGFQQPQFILTGMNEIKNSKGIEISIFPNPVNQILKISIDKSIISNSNQKVRFELLDLLGQVLTRRVITCDLEEIDLTPYGKSYYFLRIIKENGETLQTVTISKTE